MARINSAAGTATVTEIAEPHRSTVEGILRAAGHGLLTTAEADLLIRRIRDHHGTAFTERVDTVASGPSTSHDQRVRAGHRSDRPNRTSR